MAILPDATSSLASITLTSDFVGDSAGDESNTIRIGDASNGNGAGSLQCYIGGIFNNFQPVGGTVVQVTVDRANDHLGWDVGPNQGAGTPIQPPAMLNSKVGRVEKLEATVERQQKQIETLIAQLKEQAVQIQNVSVQLEASKRAPQMVSNQ